MIWITLWFIIGYVSGLYWIYYDEGELKLWHFLLSLMMALPGPLTTIGVLFDVYDEELYGLGNKTIFKRKEKK